MSQPKCTDVQVESIKLYTQLVKPATSYIHKTHYNTSFNVFPILSIQIRVRARAHTHTLWKKCVGEITVDSGEQMVDEGAEYRRTSGVGETEHTVG